MAQWTTQTLLALFGGFFLAFVLLLPYVAWSYRKRGRLGIGHTIMALAFLVYSLALVTYTLLPQPPIDAAYCAAHQATGRPVWNPLQFLDDMTTFHTGPLGNPALQQVLFNIALFVPWSVFLRSLFGKGIAVAVGSGFLVSLVIETTQLTGVWFLLPCPYRLFDTGDLAANTLGALVGALLAAGLRLAPPGRRDTVRVGEPRPVTTSRRLLGIVLDLLAVQLLGAVLTVAAFGVELVVAPGPCRTAVRRRSRPPCWGTGSLRSSSCWSFRSPRAAPPPVSASCCCGRCRPGPQGPRRPARWLCGSWSVPAATSRSPVRTPCSGSGMARWASPPCGWSCTRSAHGAPVSTVA